MSTTTPPAAAAAWRCFGPPGPADGIVYSYNSTLVFHYQLLDNLQATQIAPQASSHGGRAAGGNCVTSPGDSDRRDSDGYGLPAPDSPAGARGAVVAGEPKPEPAPRARETVAAADSLRLTPAVPGPAASVKADGASRTAGRRAVTMPEPHRPPGHRDCSRPPPDSEFESDTVCPGRSARPPPPRNSNPFQN